MTEQIHPSTDRPLSIWFFVGILTLVYGVVLLATGIYEFWHPLPASIVLSELHPTFWWGFLMTIFGSFYSIRFRPGKG